MVGPLILGLLMMQLKFHCCRALVAVGMSVFGGHPSVVYVCVGTIDWFCSLNRGSSGHIVWRAVEMCSCVHLTP